MRRALGAFLLSCTSGVSNILHAVLPARNSHFDYSNVCLGYPVGLWSNPELSGCPLWVTSGHVQCKQACPLYPRKRHQMRHNGMSVKRQKRTHAPQHSLSILTPYRPVRAGLAGAQAVGDRAVRSEAGNTWLAPSAWYRTLWNAISQSSMRAR